MKSILIQNTNNKFIQNCLSTSMDGVRIIDIDISNNLYQTFFRHKPQVCIFDAAHITEEITQFCLDHDATTSVYLVHTENTTLVSSNHISSHIRHIGYGNSYNIRIPSDIINDQLFYNPNLDRINSCVCFLENIAPNPDIIKILYPNTTVPIKLFNGHDFKHYQNLGTVKEQDKAHLLQTHRYYLNLNYPIYHSYTLEATACGCKPISISMLVDDSSLFNIETSGSTASPKHHNNTYTSFISNYLLS